MVGAATIFVHMLKWTKTVDHVDMKFITNRFCPFSNLCEGSGSNLHTIRVLTIRQMTLFVLEIARMKINLKVFQICD